MNGCHPGSPMYVSLPHFLFGPHYEAQVEGLHPDVDMHNTFVDIQPVSVCVITHTFLCTSLSGYLCCDIFLTVELFVTCFYVHMSSYSREC